MKTVYLGLGSNMGDRADALQRAITALHGPELRITRLSPVYETSPRDVADQPWFLNMVVEGETDLFPMRLLLRALNVERKLGRKRLVVKGPRVIDIDLLLFGGFVVDTPQLVIPHPHMAERRFVLEPLAGLAPELRHPVLNRTIKELLAATAGQPVKRTDIKLVIPASR